MDRYVHHELRSVSTALAVVALCVPVTVSVHGAPVGSSGLPLFMAALIAFVALFTLAQATRIRWIGRVQDFEAAAPLAEPPTERSLLRRPLNPWLFAVLAAGTLGTALAWEPMAALFPLWLALAWSGQAGLAADWERRNGKILWRGHDPEKPWLLSATDSNRQRWTARVTNSPSGSGSSGSTAS